MSNSLAKNRDADSVINGFIDRGLQHQAHKTAPRQYLGASLLGDACERRIQYTYLANLRGTERSTRATGQQLRIFAMGHCLEPLVIKWMEKAGFILSTRNSAGKQHGFTQAGGKIAGHIDGVLLGCKGELFNDALDYPALWECKTMSAKHWRKFAKDGLQHSHPHYIAQVQLYMAYLGFTDNPALLTALNKDTAELHHELIEFDAKVAQRYSDRAVHILKACEAGETLPRIAHSADYFVCKTCAFQARCWGLSGGAA